MERAKAVADGAKNHVKFVVVPDAPHASNMTHADLVTGHIQEYLQGLD